MRMCGGTPTLVSLYIVSLHLCTVFYMCAYLSHTALPSARVSVRVSVCACVHPGTVALLAQLSNPKRHRRRDTGVTSTANHIHNCRTVFTSLAVCVVCHVSVHLPVIVYLALCVCVCVCVSLCVCVCVCVC